MPVYAYKGFNAAGKPVRGTQDSDNLKVIKAALRRDGIFVTEIIETGEKKTQESGQAKEFRFFQGRVSAQDLAIATRQLATLVGAGIPLVESLAALIDQVDSPSFRSIWADVRQKVNEGAGVGDAMAAHPRAFSGLYVNMVRAGESSGALDVVLNRLADFTESQAELRSKLIGAMIYPIIMIVFAGGITSFLLVFFVPKIAKIFDSQKVALPLPTQIMVGLASVLRGYWFVVIPALVLSIWGFLRYISSKRGRPWWDRITLRLPIFGPLTRMVAITRFTKTLGTLLASGVPLLTAFDIVKNVVQNSVLLDVVETARECVKEGESIAAPLKRSGQFPPIVTHMIAVGERSGQLEDMLGNVARSYEVQVEARLRAMTSIFEPLLIIFMGVVVGFIVVSILLPLLQLSSFA